MKITVMVFSLLFLASLASGQKSEVEQIKSDLIGHTMGGRLRAWQFQSVDQIKECVINKKSEDAAKRVYLVKMMLQDSRVPGAYDALAKVTYLKSDGNWRVESVGLLSLVKVK